MKKKMKGRWKGKEKLLLGIWGGGNCWDRWGVRFRVSF